MPLVMQALYVDSDQNTTGQVWYGLTEAADFKCDGNITIIEEWGKGATESFAACTVWHDVD